MAGTLIVEDDDGFGRAMVRMMTAAGFHPLLAKSGAEALRLARRSEPESFLIDWCLRGGMSGITVTRRLRNQQRTADRPIVVMTGVNESYQDEAVALQAGADFFWVKDIWRREILFRHIRALQLVRPASRDIRLGGIVLTPGASTLTIDSKTKRIRRKEVGLLAVLLRRPGTILPDAFLWESVWGTDAVCSEGWHHTLENTVSRLRQQLPPRYHGCLKCSKGIGYSFDPL